MVQSSRSQSRCSAMGSVSVEIRGMSSGGRTIMRSASVVAALLRIHENAFKGSACPNFWAHAAGICGRRAFQPDDQHPYVDRAVAHVARVRSCVDIANRYDAAVPDPSSRWAYGCPRMHLAFSFANSCPYWD